MMRKLRYFEPREFECSEHCGKCLGLMDETLVAMLDELRHKVGRPLVVSSGFRCKERNANVKGAAVASSHIKGMAVDLACAESGLRHQIVQAAFELGFRRVGVAGSFIHLDIDPDKPQNVLWLY